MSVRFSSNRSRRRPGSLRRGITVIEVLFAMGIALMGLAGIASLLLLGGRQAGDSSRAAEGQALAQDWYGEFTARELNDSRKWIWWDDAGSILQWFDKQLASSVPSKGSTTLFRRELGRESVCLDPTFFSGRDLNNTLAMNNWYRPSVFPYYQDRYNPTVDPSTPMSAGLQWQDQPRMLRVTWAGPTSTRTSPVATSARVLEQVFFSQDDLSVVTEESDKSVAPARGISFYGAPSGSRLPLGRYAAESQYSWLATMSPTEPRNHATDPTDLYLLSLVVMKQRDRLYLPPTPAARGPGTASTPSNNPQGERLTWVYPISGNFVGGTGGRVRLISSDGADSKVHVGDWIMLAKYYAFEEVPGSPNYRPNSVFRWFRVVAVEDEETFGTLSDMGPSSDPYGLTPPNDVWAQDVVLEGPDWNFGSPLKFQDMSGTTVSLETPTTGTLIKGITGVFERVVNIR